MFKIALLATAAMVAIASPAFAKLNPNALNSNGLSPDGLIAHAPPSDFCGLDKGDTAIAHAPPSDFCAEVATPAPRLAGWQNGLNPNGLEIGNTIWTNGFESGNTVAFNGLESSNTVRVKGASFSLGGMDGTKVIRVELPR